VGEVGVGEESEVNLLEMREFHLLLRQLPEEEEVGMEEETVELESLPQQ
jgi:hypothetical protein